MKTCPNCKCTNPDYAGKCDACGSSLLISSKQEAAPFVSQRTCKKKRLAHISIHQTSKVLTIFYVAAGLFFIPLGVIMILAGQMTMGILYVLMPFIYGIIGYPVVAISCWLYNMVAKSAGGIEFTVEENDHVA